MRAKDSFQTRAVAGVVLQSLLCTITHRTRNAQLASRSLPRGTKFTQILAYFTYIGLFAFKRR
jgi:hypothetical protein